MVEETAESIEEERTCNDVCDEQLTEFTLPRARNNVRILNLGPESELIRQSTINSIKMSIIDFEPEFIMHPMQYADDLFGTGNSTTIITEKQE